jgi:hypothetical protein
MAMLQLDLVSGHQEDQHAERDQVGRLVFPAGPVDKKRTLAAIPSLLVIIFYACFYVFLLSLIVHLFVIFTRFTATVGKDKFHCNFEDYLLYRFAYFIVWMYGAKTILLLCTGCILLFLGSVFYCAATGATLADATHNVFNMLIDPSAARDEPTHAGRGVGAMVSIAGLLFFALLLTLTQDAFNSYFQWFQTGKSPVVEADHVVLVGFTGNTTKILEELCLCYEAQGGTCIVVLANESASKAEGAIREAAINHRGSKIMVRRGHPKNLSDLREVSADTCATVILDGASGGASREVRDSFVLQALISLQGVDWPINGHILALCALEANQAIFKKIGGPRTNVVHLDEFMGKLMVQSSRTTGLCQVMSSLFGYADSEFYLHPVPESLIGKTFGCANKDFPNVILAGVMSKTGETILCPGAAHELSHGETFILLAEDETAITPSKGSVVMPDESNTETQFTTDNVGRLRSVAQFEHILVIGWNQELLPPVIYELEHSLLAGSEVTILATTPVDYRHNYIEMLQRRKGKGFKNIATIKQIHGSLEAGLQTSEITALVTKATRAFILSDENAPECMSDANALTAILVIREILASAGKRRMIPVVPEMRDVSSARLCRHINVFDFLQTSVIPAQIISSLAVQPKMAPVLLSLFQATVLPKSPRIQSAITRATCLMTTSPSGRQ